MTTKPFPQVHNDRTGHLVPLRTKEEAQSKLKLVDAYVIRVPTTAAHKVLKALEQAILPAAVGGLQHLRRFAKVEKLSERLLERLDGNVAHETDEQIADESQRVANRVKDMNVVEPSNPSLHLLSEQLLYLVICTCSAIPLSALATLLTTLSTPSSNPILKSPPAIHIIPVPFTPPSSKVQALAWSEAYWPTVYRNHNPYGPQPAFVAKAQEKLNTKVAAWMGLTWDVADEDRAGMRIGAVVVDANGAVVAGAGDARWCNGATGGGNPLAHAVMRAIGLVGRKRRELASTSTPATNEHPSTFLDCSSTFLDHPLTALERTLYENSSLEPGGYLCTGLTLLVTHEPCVMCAMAVLHSRFDGVVFGVRMGTGALVAEEIEEEEGEEEEEDSKEAKEGAVAESRILEGVGKKGGGFDGRAQKLKEKGSGYGLFWRKELNWSMLAWQWIDDKFDAEDELGNEIHV